MAEITPLSDLLNFKGKLTIITGSTAGIGKGIAKRFAEAGSDLILISRTQEDLDRTAEELKTYGANIQTFAVDLSKMEEVDSFWEKISDQTPNVLVNNAGIYPDEGFLDMKFEMYKKVLDINLNAVYKMCYHFIKNLKDKKEAGNIVNIGSLEAIIPTKNGLVHYGVSKAGVVALTRELAGNFGGDEIRANVILPGGVMTRGAKEGGTKELLKLKLGMLKDGYEFNQRLPLGRLGRPDDIAKAALFLASDMAEYMTGTVVPVDGGFLSS